MIGTGVLCYILIGAASVARAYTGEELAQDAKVSLALAGVIVLKARPGRITDEELEKESGGSGLRYSFDIKNGDLMRLVSMQRPERFWKTLRRARTRTELPTPLAGPVIRGTLYRGDSAHSGLLAVIEVPRPGRDADCAR